MSTTAITPATGRAWPTSAGGPPHASGSKKGYLDYRISSGAAMSGAVECGSGCPLGASESLRAEFGAAVSEPGTVAAVADRLCRACVDLLQVDGASLSLTIEGTQRGTFGSSSATSRRLDELQFTYGEGPCLDAVEQGRPLLVADLADMNSRWPFYAGAVLEAGVQAVFALPVQFSQQPVGALDLYRDRRGPLSAEALEGGLLAAELAALPLLDLMASHAEWDATGQQEDGWLQLASLDRVEVYQATGMIMGAMNVDSVEALVRLRGYAFARDLTAGEAAWAIVERRVRLTGPDWQELDGAEGGP